MDEAPTMNRTPASAYSGALRLGWVRRSIRDLALLVAGSLLGLRRSPAQAPLEHSIAYAVWAAVTPGHRHAVRHLLEEARRRLRCEGVRKEWDG